MRGRLRRRVRRQAPAGDVVVATYNIHTCVGVDRRYNPPRIARVLCELEADVIALQEVDARHRDLRQIDQWVYFSEETGLAAIPGPDVRDHRGRFGNALLTRWPVVAVRQLDLSVDGREPRGAIDADLAVGNKLLRVIATHFGLRSPERQVQTERLLDALEREDGVRRDGIVVMGDLNEWRGRRGGILAMDRVIGPAPAPRTFPSWCPLLPLDRIYAGLDAELAHVAPHRSPLARVASDHLPLKGAVRWRAGT
ncbi:MAG: endonuclease/exonuclease/phosphatase family protein [Rhodospirillales bacterium]|nr:endonuclease/exonuclease/phosphatase family protein [Rhodospirillales bacterium]